MSKHVPKSQGMDAQEGAKQTRAAIYLRISADRTGEHLGVDRQNEDCAEYARTLGWDVAETFTDNDKSAYRRRPEYERMLASADAGEIDAIIAWHPDRLYRVVKDLGDLVDVCKRNNTQIATVRAGAVDLTTPTGRLVAGLLAQVATYEGEAKADRWSRSWRQGREAGRPYRSGSRMYGYTPENEVIEHEAVIIRQMAQRVLEGEPYLTTVRWLDSIGVRASRGGAWSPQGVKRHLLNPRLAGWSTLNGEIVSEGQWEPILDKETWEGLKAVLTAHTRPYVARKALLLGLLHCGRCDYRMITSSQKGIRTYRCPSRPNMPGCGRVSGNAHPIESVVESYAQALLDSPQVRRRIGELKAEPSGIQTELAALEIRVTELEAELDEPGVPVTTLVRAIARTRERQEKLLSDLAAIPLAPLPEQGGAWPDDLRRRRTLVDIVVAGVTLSPSMGLHPSKGFDPQRVTIARR